MNEKHGEELLLRHDIRPTAVRLLVLQAVNRFDDTFSLADLEAATETIDKSSIFRTLTLFAAHHLLHIVEDGSGATKYCLCRNDHDCTPDELHCHFHCERCGRTYCLEQTHIPAIDCPEGFEVHQINYLVKGLCPDCRTKASGTEPSR